MQWSLVPFPPKYSIVLTVGGSGGHLQNCVGDEVDEEYKESCSENRVQAVG